MINGYIRSSGKIILTGNHQSTCKITCPSATLSTTKPTCTCLGSNPSVRSDRPTTNHNLTKKQPGRFDEYLCKQRLSCLVDSEPVSVCSKLTTNMRSKVPLRVTTLPNVRLYSVLPTSSCLSKFIGRTAVASVPTMYTYEYISFSRWGAGYMKYLSSYNSYPYKNEVTSTSLLSF
jgi:hypothetical protein